jgi:hypothetical protein
MAHSGHSSWMTSAYSAVIDSGDTGRITGALSPGNTLM